MAFKLENKPKKVFLVHGENQPADELRIKLEHYGFDCSVPLMGQEFEI
jgi:metallo-beta-lactamase family protein